MPKLCLLPKVMDYAEKVELMDTHKKAGLVLRGFYQGFLGIAPWMSVIKLLYLWLRLKIALQFEKTVSRVEKSVQNWNHVL